MNKRKIMSLALGLCMVAILAVGGTLAYFVDTDSATNTFTVGDVEIKLVEKDAEGNDFKDNQKLLPGTKTENNIAKVVTVQNAEGSDDAYMWIEVWVPSALDDGDDNSPAAPGLGNSLHFNYDGTAVTETKSTYLGSKEIEGASYNGYVHFVKNDTAKKAKESTAALLDQVYMDKEVTGCEEHDSCLILMDGKTHYKGKWNLVINAVGFQANGVASIEAAIEEYYDKALDGHLW